MDRSGSARSGTSLMLIDLAAFGTRQKKKYILESYCTELPSVKKSRTSCKFKNSLKKPGDKFCLYLIPDHEDPLGLFQEVESMGLSNQDAMVFLSAMQADAGDPTSATTPIILTVVSQESCSVCDNAKICKTLHESSLALVLEDIFGQYAHQLKTGKRLQLFRFIQRLANRYYGGVCCKC